MILLRLKDEKVVEVVNMTSPYTPKEDEVLVERLPKIELANDEIGWLYYRNGSIVVEKEKR
jgi:hypothetical protein